MIINEIDRKLDMRGEVSLKLDHPVTEISRDYSMVSVARIRMQKQGGIIIVNTPQIRNEIRAEVSEKLNSFGSKVEGDTWSSTIDITSTTTFAFFKELIETPSVVVDAILLKDGTFHIYFRYHRNNHAAVSSIIVKFAGKIPHFVAPFLGRSDGIISQIHRISSSVALQYVQIGAEVPPSAMDIQHDPVITTFGHNWSREMKYVHGEESHAVYYEKQRLLSQDVKLKEISSEEKIYEMTFSNPLMNYYFSEATGLSIAFLGVGHQLFGRGFSFYMIIPQMHLESFSTMVFGSFSKFKKWNMSLEYSVPADQL